MLIVISYFVKIKTSKVLFGNQKCKVTFGFKYRQTLGTLIRLLLKEQYDLGPCCLQYSLLM